MTDWIATTMWVLFWALILWAVINKWLIDKAKFYWNMTLDIYQLYIKKPK